METSQVTNTSAATFEDAERADQQTESKGSALETQNQANASEEKNHKRAFRNGMIVGLTLLCVIVVVIFFLFDPRDAIGGIGESWSLGNFTLMNIAIFECFMLIIGGFVTVTRKERRAQEEASVDVKWLPRLLSIPIAAVALIAFILLENVDLLPLVYFDQWTWIFVVIVIVQTILVAFSKKRYNPVENQENQATS